MLLCLLFGRIKLANKKQLLEGDNAFLNRLFAISVAGICLREQNAKLSASSSESYR